MNETPKYPFNQDAANDAPPWINPMVDYNPDNYYMEYTPSLEAFYIFANCVCYSDAELCRHYGVNIPLDDLSDFIAYNLRNVLPDCKRDGLTELVVKAYLHATNPTVDKTERLAYARYLIFRMLAWATMQTLQDLHVQGDRYERIRRQLASLYPDSM